MSTATKIQASTRTITIAPTSCRMIRVEVFDEIDDDDEAWGISWAHVIGIACAPNEEFPNHVDVWPVIIGDSPEDGELCVADDKHGGSNMKYSVVVPCFWPPEQDQENAVRIGKELIKRDGESGGWVIVPKS